MSGDAARPIHAGDDGRRHSSAGPAAVERELRALIERRAGGPAPERLRARVALVAAQPVSRGRPPLASVIRPAASLAGLAAAIAVAAFALAARTPRAVGPGASGGPADAVSGAPGWAAVGPEIVTPIVLLHALLFVSVAGAALLVARTWHPFDPRRDAGPELPSAAPAGGPAAPAGGPAAPAGGPAAPAGGPAAPAGGPAAQAEADAAPRERGAAVPEASTPPAESPPDPSPRASAVAPVRPGARRRPAIGLAALAVALLGVGLLNTTGTLRYPGGPLCDGADCPPLWLQLPGDTPGSGVSLGRDPGRASFWGLELYAINASPWPVTVERVEPVMADPGLVFDGALVASRSHVSERFAVGSLVEPPTAAVLSSYSRPPVLVPAAGTSPDDVRFVVLAFHAVQPGFYAVDQTRVDYRLGPFAFQVTYHIHFDVCAGPLPPGMVCAGPNAGGTR